MKRASFVLSRFKPLGLAPLTALLLAPLCLPALSCKTGTDSISGSAKFAQIIERSVFEKTFPLSALEKAAESFPDTAFYAGYTLEKKTATGSWDNEERERREDVIFKLYKASLTNEMVAEAAAEKLLPSVLQDGEKAQKLLGALDKKAARTAFSTTLKGASLYKTQSWQALQELYSNTSDMNSWDSAFLLVTQLQKINSANEITDELHEKIIQFFFNDNIDDARIWAKKEIDKLPFEVTSNIESDAISARIMASNYEWKRAMEMWKAVYKNNAALFMKYTNLMTDLGRSFLYAGLYTEGTNLFLSWEKSAAKNADANLFRYKCFYYAGRLKRAHNKKADAANYFTAAIEIAPNEKEADACIWYVIDLGFSEKMDKGVELLKKWENKLNDCSYFSDLYDKAAQWAVSGRRWKTLISLFPAIEKGNCAVTRAKYAYIIGRALDDDRTAPFGRSSKELYEIAFNEEGGKFYVDEALLYYRVMAGFRLEEAEPYFIPPLYNENNYAIETLRGKFLEGFFTHGAEKYALAWIKDNIDTLPLNELRALALLLNEAGLAGDAIRLCTMYMKRADFSLETIDLQLYFPLAFSPLIERFAAEFEINPSIVYGLVRTESIFIPDIVSHAGAAGLAQLMPLTAVDTAKSLARQGGPDYIVNGEVDRTNPEANLHIGLFFLRQLINSQKTPLNALLGYNGGPTRVSRWARASDLPPDLFMESVELRETREYGKKVLASAVLYNVFHFSSSAAPLIAAIMP